MLAIHIDFNCESLTRETVSTLLRFAASCGYDSVLWEVEDMVQWETCPECVSRDAFPKAEFREILDEAKALGLAPIPLLQTFGHAEYILSHEPYSAWRELPEKKDCYCVSTPAVRDFLKRFLHEYLDLFGDDVRFFHLGGDEAYSFGKCPVCASRDRMELYAEHLRAVAEELLERGIRPGCWSDMVLACDGDSIARHLPRDFVLWHWDYGYRGDGASSGRAQKTSLLKERGYDIVFCAAAESSGDDPFLPMYSRHAPNIAAGAKLVREESLLGFCVTSWSIRAASKIAQLPLFELGARCLRGQVADGDVRVALAPILQNVFGDVRPTTIYRLTNWRSFGLEGRQWNVYKDAAPPMVGQLDYVLSENRKYTDGFPNSAIETLENSFNDTFQALTEFQASPNMRLTAAGKTLVAGGNLRIKLLQAALAVLEGRRRPPVPFLETAAFYSREQSDWSAYRTARRVWGVLDDRYADPFDASVLFHPRG